MPHAGWIYSGPVAAEAYRRLEIPPVVLLLGPNHTGRGARFSVWDGGRWEVPGGGAAIDEALRDAVLALSPGARPDREAHLEEHALEVQIPFLLARRPDVRIVAVSVAAAPAADLLAFGDGLAEAVRARVDPALVLISSDLDHHRPHAETLRRDQPAIDRLSALDPDGLLAEAQARGIRMCGVHPAAAGLAALRALGATRGELLAHRTSHDAGGDAERTVGYAAMLFR